MAKNNHKSNNITMINTNCESVKKIKSGKYQWIPTDICCMRLCLPSTIVNENMLYLNILTKTRLNKEKILNIPCHNDHIIYVVIYNLLHATVSVPGVSHSLPVLEAETNGRTNLPTNVSVAISTTSSSALHSAAQSSGTTWLVMLSQSSRVHGSGQPGRWSS